MVFCDVNWGDLSPLVEPPRRHDAKKATEK
jgi:hypothetical protein